MDTVEMNNWKIDFLPVSGSSGESGGHIPVLTGESNGIIKKECIYWFDAEKNIAITVDTIYSLKDPNVEWHENIINSGLTIKNFEIKGTVH